MSLRQVAPDTYAYIQGDGGWGLSNAGFVAGNGESLLVDTFFDLPHTRRLLDALPERPATVVNTHFNGDHCWGNELVADARIVAHTLCREQMVTGPAPAVLAALAEGDSGGNAALEYMKQAFARFDFTGITLTPPTEVFDDTLALDVGGREVHLFHYGPAHTLGDAVAWVPDQRVLFTGDLLFLDVCPLIWDGTATRWLAALDAMVALDPAVVVPGHGAVAGPEGLHKLAGYFRLLLEQGRVLHDEGVPVDEAMARLDLGEYATWVDVERTALNLRHVYNELDGVDEPINPVEAFAAMAAAAPCPPLGGGCC